MIKEVTIGQFFPGNSPIHKLDPRVKIIITLLYIIALFICKSFLPLIVLSSLAIISVIISKIPFKTVFNGLKIILFLVCFTAFLQIFYNDKGTVLWKPFDRFDFVITDSGIFSALFITIRVVALILAGSIMVNTTSPTMLTDAIERLLSPLKLIKVNVHSLAMMMTIALRFIPTLIEEIDIIMSAQKARGAQLETGSLKERAKALVPVFIPLFVNSFRRAYELAFAMECRCYTGGKGRTRLKIMKMRASDFVSLAVSLLLFAGVVFVSVYNFGDIFILKAVL
ncbi:MAG: energy-coupling factor transporter transmembrane component T [Oscillospiraceae bacterium]|nr:energy-coupling factor transporter transmembrane component T [Oscillospiraceae bacterium]